VRVAKADTEALGGALRARVGRARWRRCASRSRSRLRASPTTRCASERNKVQESVDLLDFSK
jgi:hypothetical protein